MEKLNYSEISDDLWERVEPLLAEFQRKRSGGSAPIPLRTLFCGIVYKLKTGCQWHLVPRCYGSKSTLHEHYQRWASSGVFKKIMEIMAMEFQEQIGFDLQWQSMDGSLVQAPVRKKK